MEEFYRNQERPEENCTHGDEMVLTGPALEALALLQWLLLCGNCRRAFTGAISATAALIHAINATG